MNRKSTGPGVNGTGSTLQDLLPAAADRYKAAFAGAFCFKVISVNFLTKDTCEVVAERSPLVGRVKKSGREAGLSALDDQAYLGGRSKGISLYVVNGQKIPGELVAPPG